MKYKKKVAKLLARQNSYENLSSKMAYTKPGSLSVGKANAKSMDYKRL